MIQFHLNEIQKRCNLTTEQLDIVRREMVSYAAEALMDSSVADQVLNISISESDQSLLVKDSE